MVVFPSSSSKFRDERLLAGLNLMLFLFLVSLRQQPEVAVPKHPCSARVAADLVFECHSLLASLGAPGERKQKWSLFYCVAELRVFVACFSRVSFPPR